MKTENQVCNFEQAKKLNQLGVSQDSLFLFSTQSWPNIKNEAVIVMCEQLNTEHYTFEPVSAAFTVAELGVMLDESHDGAWLDGSIWYIAANDGSTAVQIWTTEAQAKAQLLINLIENGESVTDINERFLRA